MIWFTILGAVLVVVGVFAIALCKMAARADAKLEDLGRDRVGF